MPYWRSLPAALVLPFVLALTSATASATITDAAKFNQLRVDATTAAQVVEALGEPDQENRSPDGRFAYMYEFDLPNQADPSQPSMPGVAALMFSAQGVLLEVQLMKKAGAEPTPAGE
jgi:hypothetical protein